MELREYAAIIFKRLWIILLIIFVATSTSGVLSFFVLTPQFEASAEILVNQSQTDGLAQYNEIRTNLELINTYNVIIKSPRILEIVISDYNLKKSYEQLNSQIKVSSVKNSQVMSITVTDSNYSQAVYITNAVANTFKQEIVKLMKIDNVHVMAEAKEISSPSPVSPKPYLNMVIAFVVGIMASIGLIFLLEYLDNTIKTEQDIETILRLPVLGSISKIDEKTERKLKKKQALFRGRHELEVEA